MQSVQFMSFVSFGVGSVAQGSTWLRIHTIQQHANIVYKNTNKITTICTILFLFCACVSFCCYVYVVFCPPNENVAVLVFCCCNTRLLYKQPTHKNPVSRQRFVVKVGHCEMTAPNQPGAQNSTACDCYLKCSDSARASKLYTRMTCC